MGFGIYDAEESNLLLSNIVANPPINTNGTVKIENPMAGVLSQDQIETLRANGFSTLDIFETLSTYEK